MPEVKYIYDDNFFDGQAEKSSESAGEVVPLVLSYISPKSVADIGCGIGTWLAVFRENGVEEIVGTDGDYVNVERLLIPEESFSPRNLAENANLSRTFDLVVSLEVAEHLPESSAKNFVAALTSMSRVVLFSAATPGQGGFHHINEQWHSYWRDLFAERNFIPIDCLRPKLWNNRKVQVCYKQNVFFYAAKDALNEFPKLAEAKAAENPKCSTSCIRICLKPFATKPPSLREIVKAAPGALQDKLSQRTARLFGKG